MKKLAQLKTIMNIILKKNFKNQYALKILTGELSLKIFSKRNGPLIFKLWIKLFCPMFTLKEIKKDKTFFSKNLATD